MYLFIIIVVRSNHFQNDRQLIGPLPKALLLRHFEVMGSQRQGGSYNFERDEKDKHNIFRRHSEIYEKGICFILSSQIRTKKHNVYEQ